MHIFLAAIFLPVIAGMWAYTSAKHSASEKVTVNPKLTRREFLLFWKEKGQ